MYRRLLSLIVLVFMLSGCSGLMTSGGTEDSLYSRATQMWKAKESKDWGLVYQLSMVKFDKDMTRDDFIRSERLVVKNPVVQDVVIGDSGDKATLRICFSTVHMGITLDNVCIQNFWILHKGQWYQDNNVAASPF